MGIMLLQVTTKRSEGNRKVTWPCLTDSVTKLEGCGVQICQNLADIRKHAAKLGLHEAVPYDCPNKVGNGGCDYALQPLCCCYQNCVPMQNQVTPPHYALKVLSSAVYVIYLFLMLKAKSCVGDLSSQCMMRVPWLHCMIIRRPQAKRVTSAHKGLLLAVLGCCCPA